MNACAETISLMSRLALVVALAAAALAAAPAASHARARLTCHSHHPKFHDGRIKVFTRIGPLDNQRWFLCSARFRHPKLFLDEGQYIEDSQIHLRRFGNRIGYGWVWDDGAGGGWEVGWVDVRSAFSPATAVDFDDLQDSLGIKGVAVGKRGDMAYLEGTEANPNSPLPGERVGYVPVRGKGLGRPRTLMDVPTADVLPGTLALSSTQVTWKTKGGTPGFAQLPGAPPPPS